MKHTRLTNHAQPSARRRTRACSPALGAGAALLLASAAGAQVVPIVPPGSTLVVNPLGQTIIITPPGFNPDAGTGGTGGGGGVEDIPSNGGDVALEWLSMDGGGRTYLSSGDLEFGTTVGQPDAGASSGECFSLTGGFWAVTVVHDCYANCDHSVMDPILNVADFTCFLQRYAAGDCYANCDDSTQAPSLNVADFTCFLQKFAAGCP